MIIRDDARFEYALIAVGQYGNAYTVTISWFNDHETTNLVVSSLAVFRGFFRIRELRTVTTATGLAPQNLENSAEFEF